MRFIRHNGYKAILAFAPGVGKTIPAIRTATKLGQPTLVVCRRDDYLTWKLEIIAEGYSETAIHFISHGPRTDPETQKVKYPLPDPPIPDKPPYFYVVTYDLLKNRQIFEWVRSQEWRLLICDELHYLKRWKSQRTKKVFRATRHVRRRLGLTGTFIGNDPEDIFAQSLCVDLGRTFGKKEWWFKKKYYLKEGFGWYLRKNAKDLIAERLKKLVMFAHEDDVLDLPPVIDLVKSCPMSAQQIKLTEDVLENWEIELEDGTYLDINYVIVQLQKLRQIAGGFYYDENKTPTYLRCPKIDLLEKLIREDLEKKKKIIIWGAYTAELLRICENLRLNGENYVSYFGRMSLRQREEARLSFRDDSQTRFFVGQVDRGVGMNELVIADTAIWYSNSLKVISKQQSRGRHRRRGSERHRRIYNYDLVTEGSVDEKLIRKISSSMSLAHYILDKLRQGVSPRRLLS